jgi:hypothetical protein
MRSRSIRRSKRRTHKRRGGGECEDECLKRCKNENIYEEVGNSAIYEQPFSSYQDSFLNRRAPIPTPDEDETVVGGRKRMRHSRKRLSKKRHTRRRHSRR